MIWETNRISFQLQCGRHKIQKLLLLTRNCCYLSHALSIDSRLPFSTKAPCGYLIAITFLYVSAFGNFLGIIATICLSVGFSWLLISFAESITNDVNILNAMNGRCVENHVEMKKFFKIIIEDFSDMKQLS